MFSMYRRTGNHGVTFITRGVSFLRKAVVEIPGTQKVAAIIYNIEGDKRPGEERTTATARSLDEYGKDITATISYKTDFPAHVNLLMVHCRPTSAIIKPATMTTPRMANMAGGHILTIAASLSNQKLNIFRGISKGYNLRAYKNTEPKKTQLMIAREKATIKQDYRVQAFFHTQRSLETFLTGAINDPQDEQFGSKQFVIVVPFVKGMDLTMEKMIDNIDHYMNDPEHGKIYDRMNDACVHAAIASAGIEINKSTRGLSTQDAAIMIIRRLLKTYSPDVFIDFLEQARKIGLAYPPEEIYANKSRIEAKQKGPKQQ